MFVWFSLVVFGMFGFLEGFVGYIKTFGKTQNTYPRVRLKPLTTLLFLFFLMFLFVVVFFGFHLYLWFSRMICWLCKNLRENPNNKQTQKKTKTKKTYPRVRLKPLKTLFFWLFLMFVWFSLVFGFLLYVWFFGMTCWFCKNFRENHKQQKKQKETHIQGWVWNL